MKSSKQLTKRAFSPIGQKPTQGSDRKKKSTSNYQQIAYKAKQFEVYGKSEKKRPSNYLKDMLKQADSVNKYRIVTEPVDDRVITIVSSTLLPSKSRNKVDHQQPYAPQRSRQSSLPKPQTLCTHCSRYAEEIAFLKTQLTKILQDRAMWKAGQMNLQEVRNSWGLSSPKIKNKSGQIRSIDSAVLDIKRNVCDMMRDIESLTEIDYPKMLALKIFSYNPPAPEPFKNTEEAEIRSLLGQLRQHYEGKVTAWDLQDETEESDHVKAIMRNLRARLGHYLRQNLQLRTKKAILEKAQQISSESEQYLRQIIEDVLHTYSSKN